ncbi:SLATT domain-containing protein [Bacillus cereus group sp. BfR-BA-01394]|uniref:SLATT domain-containing protein n=1 Tax=Bacillus cereus group sp. BfR-BA-01394 TaxID=2920331 RepID=UPI001F57C263
MDKETLLHNIARTAYNIGFGGKKHFVTYDMYRVFPRLISIITTIIGVYQLSIWYKSVDNEGVKDFISISLIAVGIIGLVLDLLGDNKQEYNIVGKKMLRYFNELGDMYNDIKNQQGPVNNLEIYEQRRREISEDVDQCSLSDQAIFTHWWTHIAFFNTMQSNWVVKELKLGFKDRYPIFHIETLFLVIIVISCILFFSL